MSYYVTCPLGTKADRFLPKADALQSAQRWENPQDAMANAVFAPFNTAVQCAVLAHIPDDITSPNVGYPSNLWLMQADYEKNTVSTRPIPSTFYHKSPQEHAIMHQPVEPSMLQDVCYRIVFQRGDVAWMANDALQKLHEGAQKHRAEDTAPVLRPGSELTQQLQRAFGNNSINQSSFGIVYEYILPAGVERKERLSQEEMDAFCVGALAVTTRGGHIQLKDIASTASTCFNPKFQDLYAGYDSKSALLPQLPERQMHKFIGAVDPYIHQVLHEANDAMNNASQQMHSVAFAGVWEMAMNPPQFTEEHAQTLLRIAMETQKQGGSIQQATCNILEANKRLIQDARGHNAVMPYTVAMLAEKMYEVSHAVRPDKQLIDDIANEDKNMDEPEWDEK